MELNCLCILSKIVNSLYCSVIYIDEADLCDLSVEAVFLDHISVILC